MPRVNREEFLHQLEMVQPGLSTRDMMEHGNCFIFQDNKVITFNDEIHCSANIKETSINGAVQAKPLLELLRKMTEELIEIDFTDSEVRITGQGGNRKAGIRLEKEVSLQLEGMETPDKWKDLPENFNEAISIVYQSAGRDSNKFQLTCVHIHPRWIEATDNFQVHRFKIKMGIDEPLLVSKDSIKHVSPLGVTKFGLTDAWIHFKAPSGLTISCRRYSEDYPDTTPFFDFSGDKMSLPKGLKDAAEKAEIFSSENSDNNLVLV